MVASISGAQLAAVIHSGQGRDLELDPFFTIDDVKSVIDQWAKPAKLTIKIDRRKLTPEDEKRLLRRGQRNNRRGD